MTYTFGTGGAGGAGLDPAAGPPPRPLKFCPACGAQISKFASACPQCGALQPGSRAGAAQGKSRLAAILLAYFLGSFGVHKFYLGKTVQGVLYFVFFWTLVPTIISFVEFIIYICISDEEFSRRYD